MAKQQYHRAAEDLGNVVMLEHVNLQVTAQRLATPFCGERVPERRSLRAGEGAERALDPAGREHSFDIS